MHKKGPQATAVNSDVQRQCFKTKLCAFFPLNKCQKGTSCPFAHDSSEMRDQPDWRKTKVCLMWKSNNCDKPADLCNYAHGAQELRRGIHTKSASPDKNRTSKDISDNVSSPTKKTEASVSDETAISTKEEDIKTDDNGRFLPQAPIIQRNYNYYREASRRQSHSNYQEWLETNNNYVSSPVIPSNDNLYRYQERRYLEASPMITATPDLQPSFSGFPSPALGDSHWVDTPVLIRGSCSLYDSHGEDNYLYSANSPTFTNETVSSPSVGIEPNTPWSPPLPHSSPLMVAGYDHYRNDLWQYRDDRRGLQYGRDVNIGSEDNFPRK